MCRLLLEVDRQDFSAAWYLARAGYRPLVLERGQEAQKRKETVDRFWKDGVLDPVPTCSSGEGGAGTFQMESLTHW